MLPVPWVAAMLPVKIRSPPLTAAVKVRATVFVLSQPSTSPAIVEVPVPNVFVTVMSVPLLACCEVVNPVKVKPAPLRPVSVKSWALVPAL